MTSNISANTTAHTISGQLVDLHQRRIYPAGITILNGIITRIEELEAAPRQYILPGFIDAHVHIESSMLTPAAFARIAVTHGTVATVSDPHEIANVCGAEGVLYMIRNAAKTPFKIFFGAPSCVPATGFETAGATLNAAAVADLLDHPDIWYLTELMNYPGVLHGDADVLAKIAAAKKRGKPIDGHAPGLRGADAAKYAAAGITTDHECTTVEEALDKIAAGMNILIREGSAAKNFEALHPLLGAHPDRVMFCSDDKHPDDLSLSHINALVKRALALGYNIFDVLRAACVHPVAHYGIPVGLLRAGDAADFIVVNDLAAFDILQTWIGGNLVAERGKSMLPIVIPEPINYFKAALRKPEDFRISAPENVANIRVIEALEGQLITNRIIAAATVQNGFLVGNTNTDVLKLVVINRYETAAPAAVAFIRGFGFKQGAIASTVAHDCHNIIAVGVDDDVICAAVNAVIQSKGGIAVARCTDDVSMMPLPIAGLMSDADGAEVSLQYATLSKEARALGSTLGAPFMTLSFMALLVIPALKLSDKGLFDGNHFTFVPLVTRV